MCYFTRHPALEMCYLNLLVKIKWQGHVPVKNETQLCNGSAILSSVWESNPAARTRLDLSILFTVARVLANILTKTLGELAVMSHKGRNLNSARQDVRQRKIENTFKDTN